MRQLSTLLARKLKIYLYSGDVDDVISSKDTNNNINKLGLILQSSEPWVIKKQHAGFIKKYANSKLQFYIVKGAGHEVPLFQRERAF
jgi:serine carboxypeptidase-like clade 2